MNFKNEATKFFFTGMYYPIFRFFISRGGAYLAKYSNIKLTPELCRAEPKKTGWISQFRYLLYSNFGYIPSISSKSSFNDLLILSLIFEESLIMDLYSYLDFHHH